jgi:hypothetical protein
MLLTRFDFDATTREKALEYLNERAAQLLMYGYKRIDVNQPLHDDMGEEWGVRTYFDGPDDIRYQSIYVYAQHRQKGHYKAFLKKTAVPILTMEQCGLGPYLEKKGYPHFVVRGITTQPEYREIEFYYGNKRAERSQVFMMRHIDEGLTILNRIGAGALAKKAFCLHPLLQSDEALAANFSRLVYGADTRTHILMLAMEYRNIANRTLSFTPISKPEDIILSPLPEVNEMLVADKVQNYKDFMRYHAETHPRRYELQGYFVAWLHRLNISHTRYTELIQGM